MSTPKGRRSDRVERVLRGLLGLALMAAVAWAWMNGGPAHPSGAAGALLP
ncbi:hypothetical protein [Aerolutibacter ruishenii]|uniref:Uncharacterized protein n=1 Tax=Aerolutibacter ruishenii TaxID=686800 RepID=A0A562LV74_9GAMM|nr:hypothetical protein [Lysobacter ruishenii]TWI11549.1 hypothetical protein IP93_01446 [Lysobacter ruishenii]